MNQTNQNDYQKLLDLIARSKTKARKAASPTRQIRPINDSTIFFLEGINPDSMIKRDLRKESCRAIFRGNQYTKM